MKIDAQKRSNRSLKTLAERNNNSHTKKETAPE
jgi:hypothetical protein